MISRKVMLSVASAIAIAAAASREVRAAGDQAVTSASDDRLYADNCSACHGAGLQGGFGRPLTGADFTSRWSGKGPQLLSYIATKMPPGNPGSLSSDVYHAVTRHVQQLAGMTADITATEASSADATEAASHAGDDHGPEAPSNFDRQYRQATTDRAALAKRMTPVSEATLDAPAPGDWPAWRRSNATHGFSPLIAVNKTNVHDLRLAWSLALASGTNEITPIAYQGLLFVNSNGVVQALDGASGDLIWEFSRPSKRQSPVSQPRGMTLYRSMLLVATEDAHVVALDAGTGKVIWDHSISQPSGRIQLTSGPLVAHGKIIQGVSGCSGTDIVGGCFIVAMDAKDGRELWRFGTIPAPGTPDGDSWNGAPIEQRFGASVWTTGSYDPVLNLVYFGTANTYNISPLLTPRTPPGPASSALYTNTTLALNPDTGKLVWHYQHFARDVWNLDWAFEQTLAVLPIDGKPRRVIVTIGKIGLVDIVDAQSGRFLKSYDLGLQNIVSHIDPDSGQKIVDPTKWPTPGAPQTICPYAGGGRNWYATAYDARSHRLYIPIVEACMLYYGEPTGSRPGLHLELVPPPGSDGNFGRITALDLATGKTEWIDRQRSPQSSAILATAGGLLFTGNRDRSFSALDSDNGRRLWSTRLGSVVDSFPITFEAGGVQYVAVTSGGGGLLDTTMRPLTPETRDPPANTMLWVFRLPAPDR